MPAFLAYTLRSPELAGVVTFNGILVGVVMIIIVLISKRDGVSRRRVLW